MGRISVYVFLDSSFLQGQRLVLGTRTADAGLWREYRVLGETNGDSPRSWASVIRPAGAAGDYGQLYWTDDGVLLGFRHHHMCYMAYAPATGEFMGHSDIEALSPFALIGAQTALHTADVENTIACIQRGRLGEPGIPRIETLIEASNHPNPEVKRLAAEWLVLVHKK